MLDFDKIFNLSSAVKAGIPLDEAKNMDEDQISAIKALTKAGMSYKDIKVYAEVLETSPNLPEDAGLEDVKKEAEVTSTEATPTKEEDPIENLKNLIKED